MSVEETSPDPNRSAVDPRLASLHDEHLKGIDLFGSRFETDGNVGEVRARFVEGVVLRVAGRVTAHRDMGKSHFLEISDLTGRIQLYFNRKNFTEEQTHLFHAVYLGDFLGVEGEAFTTRTGEPTIRVNSFRLLSKAMRPPPDKYHGLVDAETRHRRRYLDLMANEKARTTFLARSKVIHGIRTFLHERGFLEAETPMMQSIAGGAAAEPFKTRHNALGIDLYLRIAPELYLKRLLVGGYPKVFELNRNFRNEGVSARHNPEFTMLEAYWAYADMELMADLMEELICTLARDVCTSTVLQGAPYHTAEGEIAHRSVDLAGPWKRARYKELIREQMGAGWFELSHDEKLRVADARGVGDLHPGLKDFEITQKVFEQTIEAQTFNPLFVTHLPKELVPLAKQNADDPSVVDVFELVINGMEFAPGYTELNDPKVQRDRLLEQSGGETQSIDEEFLVALEYGMPPAGGIGLGIDRLLMLLTGSDSIRDVILFPHLRPRE